MASEQLLGWIMALSISALFAGDLIQTIRAKGDTYPAGCGLVFSLILLGIVAFVLPHVSLTLH